MRNHLVQRSEVLCLLLGIAALSAGPASAQEADLTITKTMENGGQATVIPGTEPTYIIVATNTGPAAVTGATVADTFPAALTAVFWTCTGIGGAICGATSGFTNLNQSVDLPVGGSVWYMVNVRISPDATGSLSNTATVTPPAGITDPAPANNTATHTDTLTPRALLAITKTDGQTTAVPGAQVTYTIVGRNGGQSSAPGATIADTFPAEITAASWTCAASPGSSCGAASGTGNINQSVNVAAFGSVTYTVLAAVNPTATGTLSNTATIAAPAGVTDPADIDNSATDTDTLTPQADLAITKNDGQGATTAGAPISYSIVASNLGPSNALSANVIDNFSPFLVGMTWTCSASGPGASCGAPSGVGNINQSVILAPSHSVTFTASGTVGGSAVGSLSNTATVTLTAAGATDPVSANNSATDTDTVVARADTELAHGTVLVRSLESVGGVPAIDDFRIRVQPFASYEVVVDETSGDLGPSGPILNRIGGDDVTLLQSSQPVGVGFSRSLRWTNDTATAVDDQKIRVSSDGCSTTCGPQDTYRVRAYETTASVPRFNNSGNQVTVLQLENAGNDTIAGTVYYWSAPGSQVANQAFSLAPHAFLAVNTSTWAPGVSGAITVTHNGAYGALAGRAIALDSSTGFSFDSPLVLRAR